MPHTSTAATKSVGIERQRHEGGVPAVGPTGDGETGRVGQAGVHQVAGARGHVTDGVEPAVAVVGVEEGRGRSRRIPGCSGRRR